MPPDLPGLAPGAGRTGGIIDRLAALHPRLIDLSLGRLQRLLAQLDHPERRLPPVIHVAGTNGKGSTCAFLRAIGEAAGWRMHVHTSPHLVHLTERFRVAGGLVGEAELAAMLEHLEAVNGGGAITVFEMLVAAALVLFAETPADVCVLEVGLGGRFDATNVVDAPAACAITSISLDHQDFLGDTLERIAWEKAGIMKPGRPVVSGAQSPAVVRTLVEAAEQAGARLLLRGRDWDLAGLRYSDPAGSIDLPVPSLPGPHQVENAAIAVAALRASGLAVPARAWAGIAAAEWPARMQPLHGRLAAKLPQGWELWLDGGHNEGAGRALAEHLRGWADRPVHLVVGMKQSKNIGGFLAPLLPLAASIWAVAEPGQHLAAPVADIVAASGGVARVGPTIAAALAALGGERARVLICGSLYLAGEVLKADYI